MYVSKLRSVLDPEKTGLIVAQSPGYMVELPPEALDLHRFKRLVDDGRRALHEGDPSSASASLRKALSLWRGPALADFVYEPFAQSDIARLEDVRTAARESLVDAELELGQHGELLPEIEALAAESPFAERPRAQLMLALYRAGRQADALEAYREARRELVDQLGVEPSTMLRELEQAILRQDTSLELPTAVAWPVEERRKTVTVLFADLVGSTALADELDPESWSGVQRRLFEVLRAALERHGGTVEKFAGDSVMAVFGIPTAHEDDALRAVRAAVAMRTGLAALNAEFEQEGRPELALRIGINTGEVFTGGPAGGPLVSGSVANVAKRLEEAALPGEVLLGTGTLALVRHAVTTEQLRARRGGEEGAVPAFVLLEVIEDAPTIARYPRALLVGREEELATLRNAFEEVRSDRRCRLVTILGEPGIGKTRLANELVALVGEEATVLVGRCVSYGEGATYLPLAEMMADVNLDAALAGEEARQIVAERVRELIGVTKGTGSSEEGFWAVRRLCQALARKRPLVLVFEDLQWGEPTLLDLIEHLAERAHGPILLLSAARLELREKRPSWMQASLTLEPLHEQDSLTLVTSLPGGAGLPAEARTRILETASGNPLFVEQLFAYVHDEPAHGSTPIPPTINALLTARLDGLPEAERAILERASVEGKIFQRESLVELTPERLRPTMGEHLTALIRKGLIQPERPTREAETLRFHHDLVRDAAYESLPKRTRAELHERLADWLDTHTASPDEVVGYHLEQSVRYREQLGPLDKHDLELATRASWKLASAGFRARARGGISATRHLHERAVSLLSADSAQQRVELLIELRADEALQAARALGDRRLELRALVARATRALTETSTVGEAEGAIATAEQAIPLFEDVRDESGLAKAWQLLCYVYSHGGKADAAIHAALSQIEHAQRVTDGYETPIFDQLIEEHVIGRTPVPEALRHAELLLAELGGNRLTEAEVLVERADLEAMLGRFEKARECIARSKAIAQELVAPELWFVAECLAQVELLAGDPTAAERGLREWEVQRRPGERAWWAASLMAETLYRQGRFAEAEPYARVAQTETSEADVYLQIMWRNVGSKLLRGAIALGQPTDWLNLRGDTLVDLGEVLRLAGRLDDAVAAVKQALSLYTQKRNIVSARKARAVVKELRASPAAANRS